MVQVLQRIVAATQTFEELSSVTLHTSEAACSLACSRFEGTDERAPVFIVVGTAYMRANEPEPREGRLLVFELQVPGYSREVYPESIPPDPDCAGSHAGLARRGRDSAFRKFVREGSK